MKEKIKKEDIAYEVVGDKMYVYLPEELDDHNCKSVREDMDNIMKMHYITQIIFDFHKTKFMDSSGLGVMLGRISIMQERRGRVFVSGENERISRILRLSGIYHVVSCEKEVGGMINE